MRQVLSFSLYGDQTLRWSWMIPESNLLPVSVNRPSDLLLTDGSKGAECHLLTRWHKDSTFHLARSPPFLLALMKQTDLWRSHTEPEAGLQPTSSRERRCWVSNPQGPKFCQQHRGLSGEARGAVPGLLACRRRNATAGGCCKQQSLWWFVMHQ